MNIQNKRRLALLVVLALPLAAYAESKPMMDPVKPEPNTRILLLGTFPKDRAPGTPDRRKIQEINALIAKLDDDKWIRFLDIGGRLLDREGNMK